MIKSLNILLAMLFQQSHRQLVFFLVTATAIALDGTIKNNLNSLQCGDCVYVACHLSVIFDIYGVEVLGELLVPVDVHLFQNNEPKR
jgi:hypothetical protein